VAARVVKIGTGIVAVGAGTVAVLAINHGAPTIGLPQPPPARAEVAAVIDADTVDVRADEQLTRIRLGDIDTPAPMSPGWPAACLQPQASAQLSSLIPVGTPLTLTYDTDRFGRTVAQAVTPDGRLVNAEMVRAGLAEPVTAPDDPAVSPSIGAAAQDALTNKRGVHAPDIACTVPGQVKALTDRIANIPSAATPGADLTILVAAANNATEARMTAENLASDFSQNHQDTTWSALDPTERAQLRSQVLAAVTRVTADETALRAATNVIVNQQATQTANQREDARIAKAMAEIRKAENERAAEAAHREAQARKAEAAAAQEQRDRLAAELKSNSDHGHTGNDSGSNSSRSDSSGSDNQSNSDGHKAGGNSGSVSGSKKKSSSNN
jgi:micrococcal nuclease